MRLRPLAALLLAAVMFAALTAPASARMHSPYRGHRIVPANAAPLDGFAAASGAYSFRKLRTAYAGPAIRIRRASDNAELDINFLGCTGFTGCPIDTAAANAHCAATSCFIVTWYDQSGLARDLTNATAANQPALVFGCAGSLPCMRTTAGTQTLAGAGSVTPATGLVSFGIVANRSAGTAVCAWLRQNGATGNRLTTNNVAGSWTITNGAGSTLAAASEAAWHAGTGVLNGASTFINVDGTQVTGSQIGSVVAGVPSILGSASTCNFAEGIVWDNYGLTAGEVTALQANQRNFWGF